MDHRLNGHVPSEGEAQAIMEEVEAIVRRHRRFFVDLDADARKHTVKFRAGGEDVVRRLARIATAHKVAIPGVPVDGMLRALELRDRMQLIASSVTSMNQTLSDTILQAESECWRAALAYYKFLEAASVGNAKIRSELVEVVRFFALGRRSNGDTEAPDKP